MLHKCCINVAPLLLYNWIQIICSDLKPLMMYKPVLKFYIKNSTTEREIGPTHFNTLTVLYVFLLSNFTFYFVNDLAIETRTIFSSQQYRLE